VIKACAFRVTTRAVVTVQGRDHFRIGVCMAQAGEGGASERDDAASPGRREGGEEYGTASAASSSHMLVRRTSRILQDVPSFSSLKALNDSGAASDAGAAANRDEDSSSSDDSDSGNPFVRNAGPTSSNAYRELRSSTATRDKKEMVAAPGSGTSTEPQEAAAPGMPFRQWRRSRDAGTPEESSLTRNSSGSGKHTSVSGSVRTISSHRSAGSSHGRFSESQAAGGSETGDFLASKHMRTRHDESSAIMSGLPSMLC